MRILVLPSWYFSNEYGDIAGKNFHAHALALRTAGIDARIFYGRFGPTTFSKSISDSIDEGVPTTRLQQWSLPKSGTSSVQKWIQRYADALMDDFKKSTPPHVIHAQSFLAAFVAAEVKVRTGIPYIYTEHLSDFLKNSILPKYTSFLAQNLKDSNLITAVSPGLAAMVSNFVYRPVEVLPNFYRDDIFTYRPDMDKYPVFTWVAVGEPSYVKGLDLLIKAFGMLSSQMKGVKMHLVIADKIQDQAKLIKLARKHAVEKNIVFAGFLPQEELAVLLQRSHVYISTSRYETFGTSIIEAMACGLPVIATATAGASYLLIDDQLGMFTGNNPAEIADAMQTMYQNLHAYSHETIAASAFERFNRNHITAQWVEVYRQLVR